MGQKASRTLYRYSILLLHDDWVTDVYQRWNSHYGVVDSLWYNLGAADRCLL